MEFTMSQTVICCRESRKAGSGGRLTLCPRSRSRAKPSIASGTSVGRESFRQGIPPIVMDEDRQDEQWRIDIAQLL